MSERYACEGCGNIIHERYTEVHVMPVWPPLPEGYTLFDPLPADYDYSPIGQTEIRYHYRWGLSSRPITGQIGSGGPPTKIRCGEVKPVNSQVEWLHSLGAI